jgi:glutamate synthase (NADPH/NADH) large chain
MEKEDISRLHAMITKHHKLTGSSRAETLLANWDEAQKQFTKVMPRDYKRVLEARKAAAEKAAESEVAEGKAAV